MPTIITSPLETYQHNLPIIADVIDTFTNPGILGIHLEGPFISKEPGAVGCHPAKYTLLPSIDLLKEWQLLARGHIVLITIAAELKGSQELCTWATNNNIAVSLGHQLATAQDVKQLVECGATLCTHLGNGMPNMIHRHQNPIWTSLAEDRLTCMIITDGEHLPIDAVVAMIRAKGTSGIVVTSDAAPVAGLPDGSYKWGSTPVRCLSGKVCHATLPCLAGSGSLMMECMNVLAGIKTSKQGWLLELDDLIRVSCDNPLNVLPGIGEDIKEWVRENPSVWFDEEKRVFVAL